jgi:HK97 family phage major capsid protein
MWARLWGKSWPKSIWFINQDLIPKLCQMELAVSTAGGSLTYMPPGGLSQSPYATLMGRPVIPIEQCQTLGTKGDILLTDFGEYLLIDKGGIESASSIHVRFQYDESAFRFVYRCDGQPKWNAALTPFKGSNTQSPFVALNA